MKLSATNIYEVSKSYTTVDVYQVKAKDEKEAVKLVDEPDSSRYKRSYDSNDYDYVVQIYDDQKPVKLPASLKMRLFEL